MHEQLNTYSWKEVFAAAGVDEGDNCVNLSRAVPTDKTTSLDHFSRESVSKILHIAEGENDGDSWSIIVELTDGRFAALEGSCEYTGWEECQSGCAAVVASTYEEIIRFGCSEKDRKRFGIEIDGEQSRYGEHTTCRDI